MKIFYIFYVKFNIIKYHFIISNFAQSSIHQINQFIFIYCLYLSHNSIHPLHIIFTVYFSIQISNLLNNHHSKYFMFQYFTHWIIKDSNVK